MKYQMFIIMDVLHLTRKEIIQSDIRDFLDMLMYSWNTYNLRRIDLMLGKKDNNNEEIVVFDQSDFVKGNLSKVNR